MYELKKDFVWFLQFSFSLLLLFTIPYINEIQKIHQFHIDTTRCRWNIKKREMKKHKIQVFSVRSREKHKINNLCCYFFPIFIHIPLFLLLFYNIHFSSHIQTGFKAKVVLCSFSKLYEFHIFYIYSKWI